MPKSQGIADEYISKAQIKIIKLLTNIKYIIVQKY